jgi:hypothetical protein
MSVVLALVCIPHALLLQVNQLFGMKGKCTLWKTAATLTAALLVLEKTHIYGTGIARFANDAYKSSFKNNARMEWLTKDATGFAWPFLMARTAINAHTEILYSYGDKYW